MNTRGPKVETQSGEEGHSTITKALPRAVGFDAGTAWLVGQARAIIQHRPSVDDAVVRFLETGAIATVAVSSLLAIPPELNKSEAAGSLRDLDKYTPQAWDRALEEQRQIDAWIKVGDMTPEARRELSKSLGISDRQCRRKLERYLNHQTLAALLPQKSGTRPGSTQLDPRLESIVIQNINKALESSPDISVDDLYKLIESDAEKMNLRAPGRNTVARRLTARRGDVQSLPAPIAKEFKYKNRVVRGSTAAQAPLERTQLDHTIADVHIIEPNSGVPIGRPVLSMLLDTATRVVLGMTLSLEAPSCLSVGLCIHHGVIQKTDWLRSLGLEDGCWPGYGLMQEVYTDNAQEFHASSFRRSCEAYSIRLSFRPPGHPAAGGLIERAIGTFMTKVRLLPGSSYSKLLGKAPKKVHRSARITLSELEEYLAREVSRYHRERHSTLGVPPLTAWERGWNVNGRIATPRLPESEGNFLISFLPGKFRTVTREGVSLFGLQYQSSHLSDLAKPGVKRMVRYDPRNLSRVFVEAPDCHVVTPLAGPTVPAFSIWEHQEVRRRAIEAGRDRDPELICADLQANRRLIEKAAKRGDSKAARRMARQDEWKKAGGADEQKPVLIAASASDAEPVCRVME
jgi:putative transposase